MKNLYCLMTFVSVLITSQVSFADHIVGGELRLRPGATSNRYDVTLLQFWDENNLNIPTANSAGNRDASASIYIYRKRDNQFVDSVVVTYQSTQSVVYQNKSCAVARSMKTAQGTYTGSIILSPQKYSDPDGYYMVWERCCRNQDINNIKKPGETGMVFYLEFPPTTMFNASPEFQFPNGQYICARSPFSMNMSATDSDHDELRYSLVVPLAGYSNTTINKGNSTSKTSYPPVTWENGISLANVIPGTSPLSINQTTGVITVTATQIGLYVFAVQCEELRNGKRIGMVRREFQLLVIDCGKDKTDPPLVTVQSKPAKSVQICPGQSLQLETTASNQWSYQWQLNGLNISGATSERITVSDTGSYAVVKSLKTKCASDTASEPVHVGYANSVLTHIQSNKLWICPGGIATLTANPGSNMLPDYEYVWYQETKEIKRDTMQILVDTGGKYSLKITDKVHGCTGSDSLIISLDSLQVMLPETLTVMKGGTVNVAPLVMPASGGNSFAWGPVDDGFKSNPADSSATLGPAQSTTYSVNVKSSNGCEDADSVWLHVVDQLHIPTAFSPDGNGVNDTFEIYNDKDQVVDIRIFNRWGQVIFQSAGYATPWDGSYKNQTVPPGTYPYIIKTTFGNYRGEVMVLR